MANPGDQDVDSQSPGLGMRLTIAGISKTYPSVKNISTDIFASWQRSLSTLGTKTSASSSAIQEIRNSAPNNRLIVLDARPSEEFDVGHIPGSIRVDYEEDPDKFISLVPELKQSDRETTIVCYCSVGYRSSMVAKKLQEFYQKIGAADNSPNIYNLEGSIFKWANEGRAMVDSRNRATSYVHPYNIVFGKLLKEELRKTEVKTDSNM